MTPRRTFGLVLFVVGCGSPSEDGEIGRFRPLVVSDSCPACQIEVVEVARLGHLDDSASIRLDIAHGLCMVAPLPSGEWVVSRLVGGGGPAVYDTTGRLARRIGRAGEGPGEYGRDVRVAVASDMYLVDNSNLRITVLRLPDLEQTRSFRIGWPVQAMALLESGELLLHGRPSGASGGHERLFTLTNPATGEERRFGEPSKELADIDQWTVSPGRGGGYWAASGWKYEVHRRVGTDSTAFMLARGDVPWFPADNQYSDEVGAPPPSWFAHVWETPDSLLWTYSIVPDSDWSPETRESSGPTRDERTNDMVIEVIDLPTSSVIAHTRFPTVLGPVCGSPLMYATEETELGDVRLVVLELRLTGWAR